MNFGVSLMLSLIFARPAPLGHRTICVLENSFNLVAVVVFFTISYKNNSKVSLGYTHNLFGPMLTS
jgi:hypothetical protein